jgi:membrane-associated protein
MDAMMQLLEFVLHVDRYLGNFVTHYGAWVYALLFLIIFVETGLVVMPFLPGDSLLFVVGALCGTGHLSLPWVMGLLVVAAIAGDQLNYRIGRYFGPKVFQWENSRFFNRAAFERAHNFYETYGGITIVLARFMPFIRTFVPFVAGVAAMTPSRFVLFNVVGALIWVCGLTGAGYLFGETDFVKAHLSQIKACPFKWIVYAPAVDCVQSTFANPSPGHQRWCFDNGHPTIWLLHWGC